MPNGHGGIPRFGGAVFYTILALLALAAQQRFGWPAIAAATILAAIAGWRFAYHLHFWAADEYGGAYTSPEKYQRAALRYYGFGVIYAGVAAAAVFGLAWWRGLP